MEYLLPLLCMVFSRLLTYKHSPVSSYVLIYPILDYLSICSTFLQGYYSSLSRLRGWKLDARNPPLARHIMSSS